MKYIFSIIISILAMLALSANIALAGSATISWNANSESDLSGYKIYYGTVSRTGADPKTCGLCGYSSTVNVGNVRTYIINNLTNGQTYYFSVTAYDTSNNESSFSSQVSKLINITADLNSDGRVNIADAGIMMSYWNSTARPSADINSDGIVNINDAGIMMSQWTG